MPQPKILLICILVVIAIVFSSIISYNRVTGANPRLGDMLSYRDYRELYRLYIKGTPSLNVPPYGNSSVTMVAVLDLDSADTVYFTNSIFPLLEEEFIKQGSLAFYGKSYITIADYDAKNSRYWKTKALLCISKIKGSAYHNALFSFINSTPGIWDVPERYGISEAAYHECMKEDGSVMDEATENENIGEGLRQTLFIGIGGEQNTVFRGIPSYTAIRRAILTNKLSTGE